MKYAFGLASICQFVMIFFSSKVVRGFLHNVERPLVSQVMMGILSTMSTFHFANSFGIVAYFSGNHFDIGKAVWFKYFLK